MLSNGFDAPLHLHLKPSKSLYQFHLLAHGMAMLAIFIPSGLLLEIKAFLLVSVVLQFGLITRNYRQLQNTKEQFIWQKGDIWLSKSADSVTSWTCLPNTLVKARFVIVNLANECNKRTLLIMSDQCDIQTFRRLKVRLKYYQGEAAMPIDAS